MTEARALLRGLHEKLGYGPDKHPMAMNIAQGFMGNACFARGDDHGVRRVGSHWFQIVVPHGLPRDEEHWLFALTLARWLVRASGSTVTPEDLAYEMTLPARVFEIATPEDLARRLALPMRVVLSRMGQLGIGNDRNAPVHDLRAARRARLTAPVDLHGAVANDTERRRRARTKGAA